jgi:hypothetical protein
VHINPYFGHFETLPDGKTYFNAQSFPNTEDPERNGFAAGIGRTFLGGKAAAGVGFTRVGDYEAAEFKAKLDLVPGTTITYSTAIERAGEEAIRELKKNSRIGVNQDLIEVDGKNLFSGYFETGISGEPKFKVGASLNLGDIGALDAAYKLAEKELQLRYSIPFGEKSEHFWFIGVDKPLDGGEPVFLFGINFTKYGGSRSPRRRKKGRQPTTGGNGNGGKFRIVRMPIEPNAARIISRVITHPRQGRQLLPAMRSRLKAVGQKLLFRRKSGNRAMERSPRREPVTTRIRPTNIFRIGKPTPIGLARRGPVRRMR